MMGFVKAFVKEGVMEAAVNPVDEEIGEDEEERELKEIVKGEWGIVEGVVEFGVTPDFCKKYGSGDEGHQWHCPHGLLDLETDLVLEVFGVGEGALVKDEDIG